jgi:hypothetical protein
MAPLKIFRAPIPISLDTLKAEVKEVSQIFPYELGPFSSSIPLVGKDLLAPSHQRHYNNLPSANIIGSKYSNKFPGLNCIFNLLDAPKTAFRLIKRPPLTSYELHEDTDRGKGVWRFQVPIISGPKAVICLSDQKGIREIRSQDNIYTPEKFSKRFKNHRIAALEEGWLYSFDVDHIHTLHNGELTDRVTLIIDILMTPNNKEWWRSNSHEVPI